MPRIYPKTGKRFVCVVCGKEFYRSPAQVATSTPRTCSKECKGIRFSGSGNPFWERSHTPETKALISQSRKGKAIGNKNGLGYKHTDEARKRIAEASKELWLRDRDKMLNSLPRGKNHRYQKEPTERRHRLQFTPRQRREWKSENCTYCGTSEHLELDHIIPIFDGGLNSKENSQTLCRGCNLWKTEHVDLPRYYADKSKGATINPS